MKTGFAIKPSIIDAGDIPSETDGCIVLVQADNGHWVPLDEIASAKYARQGLRLLDNHGRLIRMADPDTPVEVIVLEK